MRTFRHTLQTLITSDLSIDRVEFNIAGTKPMKKFSICSPKNDKNLLMGDPSIAKYSDYLVEDNNYDEGGTINMGYLHQQKGDINCIMCGGKGIVSEGEHDDIREVPCPCTIDEPADFSGSTEGDR